MDYQKKRVLEERFQRLLSFSLHSSNIACSSQAFASHVFVSDRTSNVNLAKQLLVWPIHLVQQAQHPICCCHFFRLNLESAGGMNIKNTQMRKAKYAPLYNTALSFLRMWKLSKWEVSGFSVFGPPRFENFWDGGIFELYFSNVCFWPFILLILVRTSLGGDTLCLFDVCKAGDMCCTTVRSRKWLPTFSLTLQSSFGEGKKYLVPGASNTAKSWIATPDQGMIFRRKGHLGNNAHCPRPLDLLTS